MPDDRPRYPYQQTASSNSIAHLQRYASTAVFMATGTGKTVVGADVSRYYSQFGGVLWLEGREHLVHQMAKQVAYWSHLRTGIEMDDLSCAARSDRPPILIASVQTLSHRRRLEAYEPDAFALIVIDECFVAGTRVGGPRIEHVRVGDEVASLNLQTGAIEQRPVSRTFQSRPSALVRVVLDDGRDLVCTPAHPFYTRGRYVPAAALREGDSLRGAVDEPHVVRVDVLEPTPDGTFGGACPDGFVYNLEVEGNHNYFANGVLAHNCHHAPMPSYQLIRDYLGANPLGANPLGTKTFGTTATPDRHDRLALAQVFDSVAFRMDIAQAIREGWLVPIYMRTVRVEGIDFSRVRRTVLGDLNERDLERIFVQERHLHEVVVPLLHHAGRRRTLVFGCSVLHCHQLAALANRIRPGCAVALDNSSTDEEREDALKAFRKGRIQFLINCGLFLEGFDEPCIECVAIVRPTESRALYAQMIGRGTRRCRETGKRNLLVLDFTANSQRLSLVSPIDVLDGDLEPALREEVQQAVEEGAPLLDAIEEARARAAERETARREVEEDRRRGIVADVRSSLINVASPADTPSSVLRGRGATLEQVVELQRIGFGDEFIAALDYVAATNLIARAAAQTRREPCTPTQALLLTGQGVDPMKHTARSAADFVTAAEKNGWSPKFPTPPVRSTRRRS